jgi:hypothetical protein
MESMLGQLIHTLVNPLSTRRNAYRTASDSAVEKLHTVQLLFPDKGFLRDGSSTLDYATSLRATQNHDCSHGDIDLDFPRDVRILIAQAESGSSLGPILLFDSKQPESPPTADPLRHKHSRAGSRTDPNAHHARTASGPTRQQGRTPTIESIPEQEGRESPTFPDSSISGLAHRARMRRSSVPASQQASQDSTSAPHRQIDEIVQTALECMFENVPSAYKGISNKLKIIPLDSRSNEPVMRNTPFGNPQMPHRRASHLSSVFTAADFRAAEAAAQATSTKPEGTKNEPADTDGSNSDAAQTVTEGPKKLKIVTNEATPKAEAEEEKPRRRTVLVTRTFAVPWTEDDAAGHNATMHTGADGQPAMKAEPARVGVRPVAGPQFAKPPMYAVTIILSLPVTATEVSRPSSMCGYPLHRSSGQISLASSMGSEISVMDPNTYALDSSVCSIETDVDDAVDLVVKKHWDVVMRTLSTLQNTAEEKILPMLRQLPAKGRSPKLLLHALAEDEDLKKAARAAGLRVVRGIKIPRVQTGQGQWGNWRDEARWIERWADVRDKNFLFNLLNAFLGTHTEWLNVMAPYAFRSIVAENQRLGPHGSPEDLSVPSRTIVVSTAATTSRRLVYLLSQFLPANHNSTRGNATPFRPGTAQSSASFSQSPPSLNVPSRHESLRRSTIKRQGQPATSAQGTPDGAKTPQPSPPAEVSECRPGMTIRFEDQKPPSRRTSDTPRPKTPKSSTTADVADGTTESTLRPENMPSFSRSSSDSRVQSANKTTSPLIDVAKKSLPTNSTMSTQFPPLAFINGRPGSRDSNVSENLISTLQRTVSGESQPSSRWGSLKSLWSGSSRLGSESSDPLDNDEGLGIVGLQHSDYLRSKLQQMVQEGEAERAKPATQQSVSNNTSPEVVATPETLPSRASRRHGSISQPINVPNKLEMSVNPNDGVIDISFPFASPPILHSPPFAGYYSAAATYGSQGHTSWLGFDPRESDRPLNVAGVLNSLHPDFALQAVTPYSDMEKDIKAIMMAEPIPASAARRTFFGTEEKEDWVEVCTTLIADTRTLTITRLRLERKVRFLPTIVPTPAPTPSTKMGPPPRPMPMAGLTSKYGNPYTDAQLAPVPTPITLEERFMEEKIVERDEDLAVALERILAHSGRLPKVQQSGSSSRSSSRPGRRGSSNEKEKPTAVTPEVPHTECRARIMNSLHQITHRVRRERADERNHGDNRIATLRDDYTSTLREGIMKWYDDVYLENKALATARAQKLRDEKAWYNDDASTIRAIPRCKKPAEKKTESIASTSSKTPTVKQMNSNKLTWDMKPSENKINSDTLISDKKPAENRINSATLVSDKKPAQNKSDSDTLTSGSTTPTATPSASQFLAPPTTQAGPSRT